MNRYNVSVLAILVALCTFSCKKTKKATPLPIDSPLVVVYDNYTQLKPGNYWIYQDYKLDSVNGAAHPLGTTDSSYVEKDTMINNHSYHKYVVATPTFGSAFSYEVSFMRDSLSYTVNEGGWVLFSSQDFTNIFASIPYRNPAAGVMDTIIVTDRMGFKDVVITVEAGTFTTSAFRRIYPLTSPTYHYGPTGEYDHRYAKGVGLISETTGWYIMSSEIYERRLVRYHVQ